MYKLKYCTIWITNDCNSNCLYCYKNPKEQIKTISPELIDKTVALLEANSNSCHIQLAGGEPTLEPEIVKYAVNKIVNSRLNATIGIQTNGRFFNKKLIDVIKKNHIQVGVSIDGPPKVHNKNRKHFAETYKNIEVLSQHNIPIRITTVVTQDTINSLSKTALFLSQSSNIRGMTLDLCVQKENSKANGVTSPTPLQIIHNVSLLIKTIKDINRFRETPFELRELNLIKNFITIKKRSPFCHAEAGASIAIHPDSKIYPCSQTMGDLKFCAGTIDSFDKEILRIPTNNFNNKNCVDCPLKGKCPGDCPSRLFYNSREKDLHCYIYQTIYTTIQNKAS